MLNPIHRKMWHLNQEMLSRRHIKRVGGFTATRFSFKPKIKNKKQKRKKVLVSFKKKLFHEILTRFGVCNGRPFIDSW